MFDLSIDLRQALLAAHGEHGVAECHENSKQAQNRNQPRAFQKAQRIGAEFEVGHGGRRG